MPVPRSDRRLAGRTADHISKTNGRAIGWGHCCRHTVAHCGIVIALTALNLEHVVFNLMAETKANSGVAMTMPTSW